MKDILICNNAVYGGGVEIVMRDLACDLAGRGYRVTVAAEACSRRAFYARYPKTVRYARRELVRLYGGEPMPKTVFANAVNALYAPLFKLFLKKRFDVAIAMKEGACMRDIASANAGRRFAWVHTDYNYDHWTKLFFPNDGDELACMKEYDGVVCVSRAAADAVRETVGDPGNLVVRYNPIDVERIRALAEGGVPGDMDGGGLHIVSVGRLAQQKNFAMLLRACARLEKKHDFTLYMIGKGPQRAMLEGMIRELGLENVRLLGARENPYPYIRHADVLVSSAQWESYGLAIAEAQVLGVPVVTTACPAVCEVFDPGCGILCENDEDALTDALDRMLGDARLRAQCRAYSEGRCTHKALFEDRMRAIRGLWEGEDDAR